MKTSDSDQLFFDQTTEVSAKNSQSFETVQKDSALVRRNETAPSNVSTGFMDFLALQKAEQRASMTRMIVDLSKHVGR